MCHWGFFFKVQNIWEPNASQANVIFLLPKESGILAGGAEATADHQEAFQGEVNNQQLEATWWKLTIIQSVKVIIS